MRSPTVPDRWFLLPLLGVAACAAGVLTARAPAAGLALGEVLLFALLRRTAEWAVLVVPAAWVLVADSTFLGAAAPSSLAYNALDLWTLLSFASVVPAFIAGPEARRLRREPGVMAVALFWSCFAAAALGAGLAPGAEGWVAELRSLAAIGWLLVAASVASRGHRRAVHGLCAVVVAGLLLKGLAYWATGRGTMAAGDGSDFRAFGSEEATIGLLALAAGAGAFTGGARSRWRLPAVSAGGALLLLSALRAYWIAGILVVAGVIAIGLIRAPKTAWRALGALVVAGVVGGLTLLTVGRPFYESTVAGRLPSGSAQNALANDPSLAYRALEWVTVRQAVGSQVVFGLGLGAEHRAVYWYNPGDPELWASLARYAHNNFLWAFLKAGAFGVAAVAALYIGLFAQCVHAARRSPSDEGRWTASALAVAVIALAGVGLFNAHISETRYMMAVGAVFGALAAGGSREGEAA